MRVLFDAAALQCPGTRVRGIGRYATNLLAALREVRPGWEVEVVAQGHLAPPDLPAPLPVRTFVPPRPFGPATQELNERYYGDWLAARRPDWVLHSSTMTEGLIVPRYATPPRHRSAAVAYDLIPLLFPDDYLVTPDGRAANPWYHTRLRQLLGNDLLLGISEATARDLRQFGGPSAPPVVNIAGAADHKFRPLPADRVAAETARVRAAHGLTRPFVLYVGGFDPRKNMAGAVAGFAALSKASRADLDLDLVLACHATPTDRDTMLGVAAGLGVGDRVRVTGYVSDADLVALYHACRLFFFPSLYEGLGLPLLEAQHCGAAVVSADNSSLPEYAGPFAHLCDATSPASMAAALAAGLAEPVRRRAADRQAFAASFCWPRVAEAVAAAVEGLPARGRATAPARPRLAWVSPAPPQATGIADYAAEVAEVLADRFDLEWVVDADAVAVAPEVARRFRVLTAADLPGRHAARPFDLFVYQMGNSQFHAYQLPLMDRFPGLTVLHDLCLGGLWGHAARRYACPDPVDMMAANGDDQLADWCRTGRVDRAAGLELAGFRREVLERSAYVVVHSPFAWRLVRQEAAVPVAIVPLLAADPGPTDRPADRRRFGFAPADFVVVTLGHIGPSKRLPSVVAACGRLPAEVQRRTRLVHVGHSSPHDHGELRAVAARAEFAGRVEFRGYVPLDDLAAYAAAADVCAQLRYPSRGESSAALMRAMAAGAACVTSDQGSMGDLPNTAVLKVRSPGREVDDLTAHLTRLAARPAERDRLAAEARRYALAAHGPAAVAAGYATAAADAICRLRAADADWVGAAARAVEAAPGEPPPGLLDRWAALRATATTPARRPAPRRRPIDRPAADRPAAGEQQSVA